MKAHRGVVCLYTKDRIKAAVPGADWYRQRNEYHGWEREAWQEEAGILHIRNSYNRYVMTAEVFLRSLYLLAPTELNDLAGRLDSYGSEGSSWKVDASILEIYWLGLGLCCPDICAAAAFCNVLSGKIKELLYSTDTAQIGGQGRARSHSLMELKVVEWLRSEWGSFDVPWKG